MTSYRPRAVRLPSLDGPPQGLPDPSWAPGRQAAPSGEQWPRTGRLASTSAPRPGCLWSSPWQRLGLGRGPGSQKVGSGGAGKGHVYNLWDCFQHIINSDYWLQISAGNQRVTGFYGAVERTSAVSGVTSPLVCSAVLSILPSFDAREQRKIGKCPQVP